MDTPKSSNKELIRRFNEKLREVLLENPSFSAADQDPLTIWVAKEQRRLRARLQKLLNDNSVLSEVVSNAPLSPEEEQENGRAPRGIAQLREPPGFVWESVFDRWAEGDEEG
jgi:hypothetical protein